MYDTGIEKLNYHLRAFHNVVRASLLDVCPASIIVRRKKYPPTSTSTETIIPPLLCLLCLLLNSDSVCNNQGKTSPPPSIKRQNVIPCSPGAVPTSGRAALPEPRKNASNPTNSTSIAIQSIFSNLCSTRLGAPTILNTSEISVVLVDIAEDTNILPSNLLRDHSGTLVAVSDTP